MRILDRQEFGHEQTCLVGAPPGFKVARWARMYAKRQYCPRLPSCTWHTLQARDQACKESQNGETITKRRGLVAASLGCYGALLANGAEYSGEYGGISTEELMDFHRHRLRVMSRSGADVLAFETVPSLQEAEVWCQ